MLMIISFSAYALEYGDRGEQVRQVQGFLSHLGYDITADGIYGYQTVNIVKDFQKNNGLTADGIVGDKTFQHLKEMTDDIEYTIKKRDTLSTIARKFDTNVKAIKNNNNLNSDKIIAGETLLIPKAGVGGGEEERIYANIKHQVERGDSLSRLARKYGTDIQTIKLANNLRSDRIYVGQNLVIPHLTEGGNHRFHLQQGAIIWPVLGRISSRFGWRTHPIKNTREFHQGLDIAVPIGTKIRAAAPGTVIQSGWLSGFGKTIVIDHGEGVKTLYAHNSRLLVPSGAKVNIGGVIALAGSTGRSTGPHSHFGLLVNEKPVNPMKYLP